MSILRRITLSASLVLLLLSLTLMGACQPVGTPGAPPAMTEAEQAADELAQDIGLLYTLNRLDVQPTQLDPLLAVANRAAEARVKFCPQRQAALAQLVPLLREKRGLLMQDKDVPADLEKQLRDAQAKVDELADQASQAGAGLIPEVRKILSADQVAIISGSDEAQTQADELLEWVRELPAGAYAEEAKSNADQLADPGVKLTSADIIRIFDEARKLSAKDYQATRQQYVSKLAPLYAPTEEAVNQALGEFMASARLTVLLRERGAK